MNSVRLYVLVFWIFTAILVIAIVSNIYYERLVLTTEILTAMGIIVVAVLCDQLTRGLESVKKLESSHDEEQRFGESKGRKFEMISKAPEKTPDTENSE